MLGFLIPFGSLINTLQKPNRQFLAYLCLALVIFGGLVTNGSCMWPFDGVYWQGHADGKEEGAEEGKQQGYTEGKQQGYVYGKEKGLLWGVIGGVLAGMLFSWIAYASMKKPLVKRLDAIKDETAALVLSHKNRMQELQSEIKPLQDNLANLRKLWAEAGEPTQIESAFGKAILGWGNIESCLRKKEILNGREGSPGQLPTMQKIKDSNLSDDIKFQLQQMWGSRNAFIHSVGDANMDARLVERALQFTKQCNDVFRDLEQ